jgi:hypothetical protein
MIEVTTFTKTAGALTKRISLAADGTVKSDGSACLMAHGSAQRMRLAGADDLAALIEGTQSNQALALGVLRPGLPDRVTVVTKSKLNGAADVIARTGADIVFRRAEPAWALLDFDRKGMPDEIASAIRARGGLWQTLLSILPALRTVEHVARFSTSAGLFRTDTGDRLPFSGGQHIYLLVRDGADVERFLKALHERCWLHGFGWFIVNAGGQLLERSTIDRMVGAPERLVFEGAPILDPPLSQDREKRRPEAVAGGALDTATACPPLTIVETSRLGEVKAKSAQPLDRVVAQVRRDFEDRAAQDLVNRAGLSIAAAKHEIARQSEGVLLPDVLLPFDDDDLSGCTVGDVLADPARFEGATLADPLEGIAYGRSVALVMRRADGAPWIHSFAHGKTIYVLKHNAASVAAAINKAGNADVARIFAELALDAEIDPGEMTRLRNDVAKRSGLRVRDVEALLKEAREERANKRRREDRKRRTRERQDPRPSLPCPADDAQWIPSMIVLNDVIGASAKQYPPGRDVEGLSASTAVVVVGNTHAFTADTANPDEGNAQ